MDASLTALSLEECLALLSTKSVGRVAYTDRALPAVLPVNYALDAHRVIFRTREGGVLARQADNAVVAFEVDDVDEGMRRGWSVLVTGVARLVRDHSEASRLDHLWAVPYAGADRRLLVAITPGRITGRRVGSSLAS